MDFSLYLVNLVPEKPSFGSYVQIIKVPNTELSSLIIFISTRNQNNKNSVALNTNYFYLNFRNLNVCLIVFNKSILISQTFSGRCSSTNPDIIIRQLRRWWLLRRCRLLRGSRPAPREAIPTPASRPPLVRLPRLTSTRPPAASRRPHSPLRLPTTSRRPWPLSITLRPITGIFETYIFKRIVI